MASTASFETIQGSTTGALVEQTYPRRTLRDNEVLIRITYSGVCGTDLHCTELDMTLGHEGIGVVESVGDSVKGNWKIGERIGFGYVHGGCSVCVYCIQGLHIHCTTAPRSYMGADLDQGSFASHAIWPETLLHRIPEALTDAQAAPLFCAGQTVFSPLERHVKAGQRIGIVGIGGLGHLAIQFANAWGCDVVVFSGTEKKKDEAIKLGAKEFVATKGLDAFDVEKLDHLFVTTSQHPKWAPYLAIMKPFGKIFPMTVTTEELVIPFMPFLLTEISFIGACSASPVDVDKMLKFAASHGIKPILEEFPLSIEGATTALEKLKKGEVRYRAVLKA